MDPKKPPEILPPQGGTGARKHEQPPPRLEGTELPDHLRQKQLEAQREPPKPVKLDPAKDDLGEKADAPPVPPKAAPAPVPRLVHQSERSPDAQRLARFKIRCDDFGTQPTHYVLAPRDDRQGAIDHYLEATGIRAILDAIPEPQRPVPRMAVRELPD